MTIGYDPDLRLRTSDPAGLPPCAKKRGRKTLRTVRGTRAARHLEPCAKGERCSKFCRHVPASERAKIRETCESIMRDIKAGARQRKMEFIFGMMQTVIIQSKAKKCHPDAIGRQKCSHCKFDNCGLWDPPACHTYRKCNRRHELRNDSVRRTKYYLHDGQGMVEVCSAFWRNTMDIGEASQKKLAAFSRSCCVLPPKSFSWGGSSKTNKENFVLEYLATVPRHFSHFSVGGTFEYVDCAASIAQLWKGPTELNDDGTTTPCFLEWADERNQTTFQQVYSTYGWWPGMEKFDRANKPASLCAPNAPNIPAPSVSYNYFWSIVKRYSNIHMYVINFDVILNISPSTARKIDTSFDSRSRVTTSAPLASNIERSSKKHLLQTDLDSCTSGAAQKAGG